MSSPLPEPVERPEPVVGPRPELVEGPRPELVEGSRPELVEGPRPELVEGSRPEPVEGSRPELVEGPTIGVLALQGDVREHLRSLTACGARAVAVRRSGEIAALDGIVLPGGESTTIDKLSRSFGVREPLVAALRAGLPAYGSCAGMILLADELLDAPPDQQTFGGLDITVRRNAFGRQVDSFETDLDLAGIGRLHAVFIRAPWVERVGPDVDVLGTVDVPRIGTRAVAVRQDNVFATSFHPEVTGDLAIHRYFLELVSRRRAEIRS